MAAITAADIVTRRAVLMKTGLRLSVIIAIPTATSDATAGVFKVKDPDPGDAANAVATEASNAKGGTGTNGLSWKAYSYAAVGTAYGL